MFLACSSESSTDTSGSGGARAGTAGQPGAAGSGSGGVGHGGTSAGGSGSGGTSAGGAAMGGASMGGAGSAAGGAGRGGAAQGGSADGGRAGAGASGGRAANGGAAGSNTSGAGPVSTTFFFSPYKDTTIGMNWNTNVISSGISGSPTELAASLAASGAHTVTLAFATGECGSENWGGVPGDAIATANASRLATAGVRYIVSTGGAAGAFKCTSDSGFETFVSRWLSAGLVGFDFDIEAGQSKADVEGLVERIRSAHAAHPELRFSLTLATLANNDGASTARSLGSKVDESLNVHGTDTLGAVRSVLGFDGTAATWPDYVTVNLMTMDYGSASSGVCVVSQAECQMGESALQAAYNVHDRWGVPFDHIELTPMLGQNDTSSEQFTLADVDTVAAFALAKQLAGIHYWSHDRDVDCAKGAASATCNSMGAGYAGPGGYLERFLAKLK